MRYLKLPNLKSGEWCDKDHIMLEACFQLLVDFIEKEKAGEVIDWQSDELHSNAWKEMQELYRWWAIDRPRRTDPINSVEAPAMSVCDGVLGFVHVDDEHRGLWKIACKKSIDFEDECDNEDQKNLHRLIEIRPFMWT